MFEVKHRDGLARICNFKVNQKKLITPTMFVVYNPNIPTVDIKVIKKLKLPIITSTYILMKSKNLEEIKKKGIHRFLGYDGVIMTDSGAFQAYQYKDIELKNEDVIKFQKEINVDIGVILDVIVGDNEDKEEVKKLCNVTYERAKELMSLGKGNILWAGPIQGGMHFDIIRESCKRISSLDFDVFCIGSVVPFLETYRLDVVINQILTAKQNLPFSKPVHLFGAGHPFIFSIASLLGIDLFDSAYYALAAKRGKYLLQSGQSFNISEMNDVLCTCPICSKLKIREFTLSDLATHNLYVIWEELQTVKQAILEQRIWELVEQRIKAHPVLVKAYNEIKKYKRFLEKFEPSSRKKGVLFFDDKSLKIRPIVSFTKTRLKNVSQLNGEKTKDTFEWCGLKVPKILRGVYPFYQSVFPEVSYEEFVDEINLENEKDKNEFWKNVLKFTLAYQYCSEASRFTECIELNFTFSKKRDEIARNVYSKEGELLGTIRARDGLFIPTLKGARILWELIPKNKFRVVVDKISEPFIKDGKNVFSKFIVKMSNNIHPFDEIFIENENGELIACGTSLLTKDEVKDFNYGMAVKTRDYLNKHRNLT